jgi:hypothetical protein
MATISLSANYSHQWTRDDLLAYNIRIMDKDFNTFFSYPNMPPSTVHPDILNNVTVPPNPSKSTRLFFRYMKDAMIQSESAVNDFGAYLLTLLGYDEPDRVVHKRLEIGFIMSGIQVFAQPAICVEGDKLLLVQEIKVSPYCLWSNTLLTMRCLSDPLLPITQRPS